jgi:hypothetical protein
LPGGVTVCDDSVMKRSSLAQVVAYDRVLPERWLRRLRANVIAQSGSSDGSTIWYDLRGEPTTLFEQVVQLLYRTVLGGRGYAGAEYWMRVQAADRVFFLHFDRDEAVRTRYVCPHLSSVFYLSESGGPTVILPATPSSAARPRTGAVVWPSFGRYALFPGDLLHGVLPGPPSRWRRVAFFVNWWRAPLTRPVASSPRLRRTSPPGRMERGPLPAPRRCSTMPESIDPEPFLPAAAWPELRARLMAGMRGPG